MFPMDYHFIWVRVFGHFSFVYLMIFPCLFNDLAPTGLALTTLLSLPSQCWYFWSVPPWWTWGGILIPHCSQDIALAILRGLVLLLFFVSKCVLFVVDVCSAGCQSQELMRTRQVLYHEQHPLPGSTCSERPDSNPSRSGPTFLCSWLPPHTKPIPGHIVGTR